MIDCNSLFRELLTTFFQDFIDLFFPKVGAAIDPQSIRFLDYRNDNNGSEENPEQSDLLCQVKLRGQDVCFWIHLEHSSNSSISLERRVFHHLARLDATYNLPVYPVVIFPQEVDQFRVPNSYRIDFVDRKILDFNFVTIQLQRLNWRDFLKRSNPVAAALIAAMAIPSNDRAAVKAESLRMLTGLQLDSDRTQIVSHFISTYLQLQAEEEQLFRTELERMGYLEREKVLEILHGSKQQGIQQGAEQEAVSLVLRLLNRRLGMMNSDLESQVRQLPVTQVEDLGEALLDFNAEDDLVHWLKDKQN